MSEFLVLAVVLLLAGVIAVPVATRLGLGSVLGYLLAGMAISPLLGFLSVDVEALQRFAEFGVVMMLFLIGLELKPRELWKMRKHLIGLGGGQVVATMLLFAAIAWAQGYDWRIALTIGMIFALSSTAIVLQTLTEKRLLNSQGGEASFSVLLFQDVAVIPMLALLPLLAMPELAGEALQTAGQTAGHGAEEGGHGGSLIGDLPAWAQAIATIGAVGIVMLIGTFLTRPIFRFIASSNLRELFTAAALLFVIGIALLMTLVGLSPALGAFIAGVVLADSEYRHELEADISPFKGLLLGLFFITVGAGIDFALAMESIGTVLFWTTVVIAVKAAILLVLARIFGIGGGQKWLFSLSLAQAGEFAFVLISFAVANFVLTQELASQLLLIVALSMLLTPLLFIVYDKVIAPRHSNAQGREADKIDEENDIILAGRGRVGGIIDRMLDAAGHRATVIDYDSRQLEIIRKFGAKTYFGDATRPDLLESAGIAKAKLLIVALDEKEQIEKIVAYATQHHPDLHVIARAIDRDHVYKLWALGCRDIIRETYDSSLRMGRSAFEAMGADRQQSIAMVNAFEEMDRRAMVEVADLYEVDIPAWENEPLLARIKELRAEWDPKLREQMDEIVGRGRQ